MMPLSLHWLFGSFRNDHFIDCSFSDHSLSFSVSINYNFHHVTCIANRVVLFTFLIHFRESRMVKYNAVILISFAGNTNQRFNDQ